MFLIEFPAKKTKFGYHTLKPVTKDTEIIVNPISKFEVIIYVAEAKYGKMGGNSLQWFYLLTSVLIG